MSKFILGKFILLLLFLANDIIVVGMIISSVNRLERDFKAELYRITECASDKGLFIRIFGKGEGKVINKDL
jgi:hypothetical protein